VLSHDGHVGVGTLRSSSRIYDGGYQQYMLAPVEALVAIPETLGTAEGVPLLCAGII
jgi:D-arabinose 1-dehydrogenase-like Zn-dependent alcohol dehydrogenase